MSEESSKHAAKNVIIEDHNYDGIQEFDNPMPRWWLNIWFGTVIFSALYYFHFQLGDGQGIHDAYAEEVAAFQKEEEKRFAKAGAATEESLAKLVATPSNTSAGKGIYVTNCQACHGATGGGLVGPNLTDHHWIHGKGTLLGIHKVVSQGVLSKGMPAWNRVLSKQELENVVAYVGTMRGQNVEGGKPPEGERVAPVARE